MSHILTSILCIGFLVSIENLNAEEAKPKFGFQAVRLFKDHSYIKSHEAPDFWALMPYYLPQQDGKSCSVASVVMLINAARANQNLTASDELVTQKSILGKVKNTNWAQGVSTSGHGVSLDQLGQIMRESLIQYGFSKANVEVVHADSNSKDGLRKLSSVLIENEKSAKDFIIINFLQSEYTGDPEGAVGHIAPVAAFNENTKQVLVFDPDRQYYEPYWVSVPTLLAGMATEDKSSGKKRGYVWVKIGENR